MKIFFYVKYSEYTDMICSCVLSNWQEVCTGAPGERGRDGGCGSSALLAKKNKPGFVAASGAGRTGVAKQGSGDMVNLLSEEWENVATEVSEKFAALLIKIMHGLGAFFLDKKL